MFYIPRDIVRTSNHIHHHAPAQHHQHQQQQRLSETAAVNSFTVMINMANSTSCFSADSERPHRCCHLSNIPYTGIPDIPCSLITKPRN